MSDKPQRRQKKYTSEEMIIADIDRTAKAAARLKRRAELKNEEAELLRMADDPSNSEEIRNLLIEADRLRDKANRMTETRLVRLKNTLGAFRSRPIPLPGLEETQVVLQNK